MTLLAAEAQPAAPEGVEAVTVSADRLAWADGTLVAEGNVVVSLGAERLVATEARGTAEVLELRSGRWERADGVVTFERATVRLTARGGSLEGAELDRDGVRIVAERLEVPDGSEDVVATGATLEPCRCADGGRAALSFRARRVRLLHADVAVIEGGTVRVFDVPVLPVPWWREPLDPRRFRLDLPEVGYGSNGWSARWHGRFGVGGAQVDVGPAWREDRGGRVELAVAGPARLEGEVGWDAIEGRVRGAAVLQAGASPGPARLAVDAAVQSDPAYAEDMAPAFVDRGVGWYDRRLLAALGPLRAVGWLPSDDSAGTVAEVRVRPEWSARGVALAPRLSLGARRLIDGAPLDALAPALRAGADARASATWTAFHGELLADAAIDPLAPDLAPAWGGLARAEVPLWAEVGGLRAQLFAGARGAWSAGDPLDLETAPVGPPGVGPALRATAAVGPLLLSGEAAALYDGAWSPLVSAQASTSGLSLRGEVSADRQFVALRTEGLWAVEAGALAAADTALAWADVTWHPGRLVVGGGLSRGFGTDDVPSGAARVGYDDGCSALLVSAGFAPDRDLPDLGLKLQLRK